MNKNIVLDKSFNFAIRVVNLYKFLSKQLLRSGTPIGVNINETQAGQSKNDFIAKMAISSKKSQRK